MTSNASAPSRVLICGTNWLGDSVMSMPAIQRFRATHPDLRVTMLVKPALAPLWTLHPDIDDVVTFSPDVGGTFKIASELKGEGVAAAYVFPNSFRSACIPFLAGIGRRRGYRGKWRRLLLSEEVPALTGGGRHQAWEYLRILEVTAEDSDLVPRLQVPDGAVTDVHDRFALNETGNYVGLIPGAARGVSKRWPADSFVEVGKALIERNMHPVVLGAPGEEALCQDVAHACGPGVPSLAGSTSLVEFVALLRICRVAVCNDSGGMHVASAVGCPVVAIFGLTDPAKTGPLGARHLVVNQPDAVQGRDIGRCSAKAAACLRTISPERVLASVDRILERDDAHA